MSFSKNADKNKVNAILELMGPIIDKSHAPFSWLKYTKSKSPFETFDFNIGDIEVTLTNQSVSEPQVMISHLLV